MTELPGTPNATGYDLWGAGIQGLLGGLVNGTTVGAAGAALRDLLVQATASDTAKLLQSQDRLDESDEPAPEHQ